MVLQVHLLIRPNLLPRVILLFAKFLAITLVLVVFVAVAILHLLLHLFLIITFISLLQMFNSIV